jgi:gliding motility-associated-like protein
MKQLLLLILSVFIIIPINSQTINNCPNLDLSFGNFTNWVGRTGNCCPINLPNVGIVAGRHTIMNPGNDPIIPALTLIPPGYGGSARLGNSQTGAQAEGLRYTYNVQNNTSLFEYVFAVVLQDPGHSAVQQPRFELQILNQNNQIIPCTFYQVTAAGNVPGFQTQGNVRWRNWTKVGVDLLSYVGQNVTIEARTGDCSLFGHYGYGYLVGSCQPLVITVAYCVGDSVATLTAPSGFSSYQWRILGQPQIISTNQSHVINNPSNGITYTCTITSVMGCTATLSAVINPVISTSNFTYNISCNNTVSFTDSTTVINGIPSIWDWDFGDGSTSTSQNPTHTYSQPGVYQVRLISGALANCPDTIVKQVVVSSDPIAEFQLPNNCGNTVTFLDSSWTIMNLGQIINWSWNFGNGQTSTQQNPQITFNGIGPFNVTLTVTSANNCVSSITKQFSPKPNPIADFTTNTVCLGDTTLFNNLSNPQTSQNLWIFPDGTSSVLDNPKKVFQNFGTFNVSLIINNEYNCQDTVVKSVVVNPNPMADFQFVSECFGLPITFTNTSIGQNQILWSFGGNQDVTQTILPNHGLNSVTLTVFDTNGCSNVVEKMVDVYPNPVVNFSSSDTSGCFPLSVLFTKNITIHSGKIQNWTWDLGNGFTIDNEYNVSTSYPNQFGTYTVSLVATSDKGCSDTIIKNNYITVYPKPNVDFRYTPTYLTTLNTTVQFINQSSFGDTYFWYTGDGNMYLIENPINIYPSDTGTYNVLLEVNNNFGCYDSISHPVTIHPVHTIYIPNTFTPNNDGVNDNFKVYGIGIVECNLFIYNKWGEVIFKQDGMRPVQVGWDGKYKNNDSPQDVYNYKIIVRDFFGEWYQYIGNLNLIR